MDGAPKPVLFLLDQMVPLGRMLRQNDVYDRPAVWTTLLWHALPLSFFGFWLTRFVPIFGGFVYTLVLIPLAIAMHVQAARLSDRRAIAEVALVYYTVILIGFGGVWSFVGHFFMADFVATNIGWETGSPFQTELAFATLGLAVVALSGIWIRDHLISAIVIAKSIFWYGAAYVHLRDIIVASNFAPYNVGAPLIGDIIYPTLLLALLWVARGKANE